MIHLKQFLIAMNYVLFAIPWIEDLNDALKMLATIGGLVLTVFLIINAIENKRKTRVERKIKEQELKNLSE